MNVSKREKIIITLALLATLYAGIQFLVSGRSREASLPAVEEKPADEFLMEVSQSLAQHRLTETEKAILEKAEMPWPSQPFVQTGTPPVATAADTPSQTAEEASGNFSYTGYIDAGNRRLAIINGTEYEVGDRVADSPLRVRSISFERIILEDTEGRRYAALLQDGSERSAALISLQSE